MEAIRQTVMIPATREINIKLPEIAATYEEAEIIILFKPSPKKTYAEKLAQLQEAANDPLFLADLQEIAEDFNKCLEY